MTDILDQVSDLAIAPITNNPLSASDTVFEIADQAGDIGRFDDPGAGSYEAWIWDRDAHPNLGLADRAGVAEKVTVTAKDTPNQELTVTRGASPLTLGTGTERYWIVAGLGAKTIEDIDDRLFDLVSGELRTAKAVEVGNFRADDARFAGKPWFDVTHRDYGAVGDGVADDGAAVDAAIDAAVAAGGGVVYFPQGTYLLTTWPTAGESYAASLKFVGDGTGSIISGVAGDDFISVTNELVVHNLSFQGFNSVFNLNGATATVPLFEVRGCRFDDPVRAVSWITPGGASAKFTKIVIEDNVVDSCDNTAFDFTTTATMLGWDSLDINRNFIEGQSAGDMRTGIRVGFAVTTSVDATQALWKNISICGNVIRNTNGSSGVAAEAIVCYGEHVTIERNKIDIVTGDGLSPIDNHGIIAGIRFGSISYNKISGMSGNVNQNQAINLNGEPVSEASPVLPFCHNLDLVGNSVEFDGVVNDGLFLNIENRVSDLNVIGNVASQVAGFMGNTGTSLDACDNLNISGNVHKSTIASGFWTANMSGQNWNISGNLSFCTGASSALNLNPTFAALSNVTINGNTFEGSLNGITLGGTQAISFVSIVGNKLDRFLQGIFYNNAATTEVLEAYNQFNGVTTDVVETSAPAAASFRRIREGVQDSRGHLKSEGDFKAGDGAWDSDGHLILGTRRLWFTTAGALRQIASAVPTSSLDGSAV